MEERQGPFVIVYSDKSTSHAFDKEEKAWDWVGSMPKDRANVNVVTVPELEALGLEIGPTLQEMATKGQWRY